MTSHPRFPPQPRSIGIPIPIPIPIPPPPPPPPPTLPPLPPPRHPLCLSLGLSRLEAVPVEHCPEASAVILAHKSSGFSLCYSGDCRPSRRLASAARGVQVLVHEATLADDLSSHALRKRHSTVSEALRVANDANAGHTILTHFSQRYPKALGVNRETETEGDGKQKKNPAVVCAFDGMRVSWDALGNLAETARRAEMMFEAATEDLKAREERGGADQ